MVFHVYVTINQWTHNWVNSGMSAAAHQSPQSILSAVGLPTDRKMEELPLEASKEPRITSQRHREGF